MPSYAAGGRFRRSLACAGTDIFADFDPMIEWPDWHKSDMFETGIKLLLSQHHRSLPELGDDLLLTMQLPGYEPVVPISARPSFEIQPGLGYRRQVTAGLINWTSPIWLAIQTPMLILPPLAPAAKLLIDSARCLDPLGHRYHQSHQIPPVTHINHL